MDDLGEEFRMDPAVHVDWTKNVKASKGNLCCVVFPGLLPQQGHPKHKEHVAVVRIPGH